MNRLSYSLLCFVLGALWGWAGDAGHVASGVLDYPLKDRFWAPGLAWWVLPQFGAGGLILSIAVQQAYKATGTHALPASFPSYTVGLAGVVSSLLTYLLSSLLFTLGWSSLHISVVLAACTLSMGLVIALTADYRPLQTMRLLLLLSPVAGLGGIGWESSLCALGTFRYLHADPGMLVSHWIGWLWVGAVWAAVFPMWRFEAEQAQDKADNNTADKKRN